jgi:hypothetical protein
VEGCFAKTSLALFAVPTGTFAILDLVTLPLVLALPKRASSVYTHISSFMHVQLLYVACIPSFHTRYYNIDLVEKRIATLV